MSEVQHHKVVASLPETLEADSIYYVRSGAGFDTYVTNSYGMIVAYPHNQKTLTNGTGLELTSSTLSVKYGTTAGTAAQGNDSRITGALQSSQVVQATGTSTTSVMSQKATTDQLATKAASSHTHTWDEVTGIPATATRWPTWTEVTSKPTTFAPTAHTHPVSQVTGLDTALAGKTDNTTQVIAGTGLTGGGDLTANRTLSVTYGTAVGTAAQGNDSRINNGQTAFGWGNHASAGYVKTDTTYTAGNGLTLSGTAFSLPITVTGTGTYISDVAQTATGITVTKATPPNTDTTYAEIPSAEVTTGTASTLRTITGRRLKEAVVAHGLAIGATATTAKAGNWAPSWDEVASKPAFIGAGTTAAEARAAIGAGTSSLALGTTAGTAAQGNDSRIVNAVPNSRTITAGTGLTGGGTLAADRTLAVTYGTAAGTAAQGNDSRITGALQSSQVVQVTGTSTTSVMSQKATTDQLAAKAASSHTHPWAQVTGQPATATRWPSTAEVTGLTAELAAKANTSTQVIAGTGLTGGGTLAANRTISIGSGEVPSTATNLSTSDLNTIQAPGYYYQSANANATTARNYPPGGQAGTLVVTMAAGVVQEYTTYGPNNRKYTRGFYSPTWSAWKEVGAVPSWDSVTGIPATATRWPTFAEVTGKPTTFAPTAHTHAWAQVTGQPATATRWPTFAEVTGKPTNYPTTWASVAAIPATATRWPTPAEAGAAPVSHTHTAAQVTGLSDAATTSVATIRAGTAATANTLTDTGWSTLTLINGFTHHPDLPLQVRKAGQIVYIRGAIKRTTPPAGMTKVATLPAGYRPNNGTVIHATVAADNFDWKYADMSAVYTGDVAIGLIGLPIQNNPQWSVAGGWIV